MPYAPVKYSCTHTSPNPPHNSPTYPCATCIKTYTTHAAHLIREDHSVRIATLERQIQAAANRLDEQVQGKGRVNELLASALRERRNELELVKMRVESLVDGVWEGYWVVFGRGGG